MIKAVIFDMDGTMVDTEGLWKEINTAMGEKYGVVFDKKVRLQMMGRKEDDALRAFKEYYGLKVDIEELMQFRRKMLFEGVSKVKIKTGLYELLDLIDSMGIKKAIATSSYREFAQKVINFIKVNDRFEVFMTGDQLTHGKPDPEIFLRTAHMLGVDPSDCLVLEDAQNGIEAAYNAGMRSIALPHEHSSSHDFSKATKVISSMGEIDKSVLSGLFKTV